MLLILSFHFLLLNVKKYVYCKKRKRMAIDRIEIENFKSIKEATISLSPINILIGPNGAGKSNFINFLKLINIIYEQRLQSFIASHGKADKFLHFGRKNSNFLSGSLIFNNEQNISTNKYEFKLVPNERDNLTIDREKSGYNNRMLYAGKEEDWTYEWSKGIDESLIKSSVSYRNKYLREYFESFKIFHFHDTSESSPLKKTNRVKDNRTLKSDGSNLAAILYRLKKNKEYAVYYKFIVKTIQSVVPFFEDFDLAPDEDDKEYIELVWKEKNKEQYFNAKDLSDGTLRFIALTTLFLQPNLPKTIIIDEPELGLHPFAVNKLCAMVRSASKKSQIIISTQSVNFINNFKPADIIVVDRNEKSESVFSRLEENDLSSWLNDYSLGEIWEKNIIGGRPV